MCASIVRDDQREPWLRRSARRLASRQVRTADRYEARNESAGVRSDWSEPPGFELIPLGRHEPFSTAEYDVLPRGRYDFVRHDYYSPIPDLSTLPETVWSRRGEMPGIDMDVGAAMDLLESSLTPYIAELDVPSDDPKRPGTFFLNNTGFESVDAELLYGMIRFLKPAQIIELGSGYTTLLIGMAARRNCDEASPARHVAYDPYPRKHVLGPELPPPTRLEPMSATDVPMSAFTALEDGDVLFVDTTHTVKLGSDVNFIVLDVLPRLHPGVVVHFHDIFLPWEYPRRWHEALRYFWSEQYLLQAFLTLNSGFEILLPAQAMTREYPERLRAAIGSYAPGVSPGSMWLRRRQPVGETG
jgi:hypothetical protein